ncbi:MAG: amino acid adenylation domain-containing protein [Legionella sp.]|nr:amino acid adenylation domain-containing protein [Legionella sp.]
MTHATALYESTVIKFFESQANKNPQQKALLEGGKSLTYGELNERANQLAHCLKKHKVTSGEFVAILLEPGIDFIVSMLAVVKLGAVYLPLDTLAPELRLVDILKDAKPKLVITDEQFKHLISEDKYAIHLVKQLSMEAISYPRINLDSDIAPDAPLYMLFTSGSTGKPKGVIIPHRAVVNLVAVQNDFQLKEADVIGQFNNLAFDASPYEVWSALVNGGCLAIVPHAIRTDAVEFKSFLERKNVHYLCLPTGFFHQVIKSSAETLDAVKVIVFGGEQVNMGLLKKFLAYRKKNELPMELINGYGPTETTAYTCRQKITEQSKLSDELLCSIGLPVDNTKLYILDEQHNPVEEGELYISGVNLALRYHNSKAQNKEKFIANPFSDADPFLRLYKTGDKARQLPSGEFLFLGRLDDQVKIGGFRIHLNEIENQLMRYPSISLAAVQVEVGGGSHKMLTAYLVLSSKKAVVKADEIRAFLSETLPSYMLPAKYVKVDELPLTLTGKVDKSKLESMPQTDLSFHKNTTASSSVEEKIKKIWQHLLNRSSIDTNRNMFELGANSLLIAEACEQINKELQTELHVSDLLTHPTIYRLSSYIKGRIEAPETTKVKKVADSNDVAIVGMACRLPGANSVQEYWTNLCEGKECLKRFDEEQLSNSPMKNKFGDAHFVPVRGVLDNISQFDANFFGFIPGDAQIADPQQRLLLECAWEALEHASIAPKKAANKTISVFAGMSDSTYLHANLQKNRWFMKEHNLLQQHIATSSSMLSTQISYRFNLKGRSLNVNTACSTGLVAVEQACQDLILGHSDVSLAGATSIVTPQEGGYMHQNGGVVSPDGSCRPLAESSNGTVFSNGVGVVVLKRLADAIADGDKIYAVIHGRGVNNDGSDKLGFSAPSTKGQMACIREAMSQAKVKAGDMGYLEAHATAISLGDVIEINALTSVYREETAKKQYCYLGSVKGNIGHTEVTSGIAGLIKTVLCLHHQKIPPMCHWSKPNPALFLNKSPFKVNGELKEWTIKSGKRYAGVSSFGVGGTNIHLVLGEYLQPEVTPVTVDKEQLMILSAKTEKSLEQNTHNMLQYVSAQKPAISLADVAYTLQTGREDFEWRRFAVGKTVAELKHDLTQKPMSLCNENLQHKVAFMFPGQGMQYHLMAMDLMEKAPLFRALVEKGVNQAANYLHCDLLSIICNPEDERINQTQFAQPILFIIEYALAQLLMSYGIKPEVFIGHSLGEYVAACLADVFSFEDAIVMVCGRGLLMASAEPGAMLAIECSEEEFLGYQKNIPVELALQNAPNHCVASGTAKDIDALEQLLLSVGKSCQRLKVSHAFHSRLMATIEKPFKELMGHIALSAPLIPIVSNVTGTWMSAEEACSPDYWYRHLRHTVKLNDGFNTLLTHTNFFFVEVGPGYSLSAFLKATMRAHNQTAYLTHTLPNHHRQTGDYHQLLVALGELWQQGVNIDWNSLHEGEQRQHVPLPTYAFQRQHYWVEPDSILNEQKHEETMYQPVWSHHPAYLETLAVDIKQAAEQQWIVFKDKNGFANHFIEFFQKNGLQTIIIEAGAEYQEKTAAHFVINVTEKKHYVDVFKKLKKKLKSPIILHLASCNSVQNGLFLSQEINQQLDLGFYNILYMTQAYIEQVGAHNSLKCAIITTGTQNVIGTEIMSPVNASLAGPCRVIMQEHNALKYRLLDINVDELSFYNEPLLHHLINSCLQEQWDVQHPIIAYRNGFRWDLGYSAIQATEKHNRFKDGGVYLITGGLGGIALSLCQVIAKKVSAPQFILLSRSPVILESQWDEILQDEQHQLHKKVKLLKKIQDLGAVLWLHQADVTQLDSLASVMAQYPQIDGVLHTAGIAGSGLVQLKSKAMADDVLIPKIHGTYNLAKALQGRTLDFVALMSSIAALTGEKGQVDYCAANACLDAFADSRLFSAHFVVSLNWNTWRDVGMTVETQRPDDIDYFDRGNDISPQQGQQLFMHAMEQSNPNVALSNYDLEVYTQMLLQAAERPKHSQVKAVRADLKVEGDFQAPKNVQEEKLALLWQESLGIDTVGVNDDFFALGGHSLKALSLIEKINKDFDSSISIQHLYKAPTISQLSELMGTVMDLKHLEIIVPLKKEEADLPQVFFGHPASGLVYCFNHLVSQWQFAVSMYGLQDPSISAGNMLYDDLPAMAKAYLAAIKKIQPKGPYFLVGYSFGGSVLYEVAHLLQQEGEQIGLLALIDSWSVFSTDQNREHHFKDLFCGTHKNLSSNLVDLAWERMQLLLAHQPTQMSQDMVLFKATDLLDDYKPIDHPLNGWSKYNNGIITCHNIEATHETILNQHNGQIITNIIQQWISNMLKQRGNYR